MIYTNQRRMLLNNRLFNAIGNPLLERDKSMDDGVHLFIRELPAGVARIESLSQLCHILPRMHSLAIGKSLPIFIKCGASWRVDYLLHTQLYGDGDEITEEARQHNEDHVQSLIDRGLLYASEGLIIDFQLKK